MRSAPFYNYLLETALLGSIMILLMLPVRRFFRNKLGSRAVYFIWLLVALRLLLPFSLPNPAMNELRPTRSTNVAVRPIADQFRIRFTDAASDIARSGMIGGRQSAAGGFFSELSAMNFNGVLGKRLLLGYGLGAAGVLVYMAFRNAAFRGRLKRDRVGRLCGEALEAYKAVCETYRVKPIPVYLTDPLPSACLVGAIRPFIALPLHIKKEELQTVLAHEICHYKARDGLFALLRNLCCAVHWYNPLVWLGARLCRIDCELACDDRVTRKMDDSQKMTYANTLLVAASRKQRNALTVVATGMTMKGRHLKKRLAAIVQSKTVRKSVVAAVTCAFTAVLALSFATSETSEAQVQSITKAVDAFSTYVANAPRTQIADEAAARAYANAFLESTYVQCADAADAAITFENGEWTVAAHAPAPEGDPLLRFDGEGVVSFYNHTFSIGETKPSENPYNDSMINAGLTEIMNFTYQFADTMLPGVNYESIGLLGDVTDGAGRYITFSTSNALVTGAHRFVVQAEPVLKVLAFELTAEKRLSVYGNAQQTTPELAEKVSLSDFIIGLEAEMGPFMTWSLEDKAKLSMQMPVLYAQYKENLGNYTLIGEATAHTHSMPATDDISREEALAIAQDVLAQDFALSREDLSKFQTHYGFYADDSSAPVWEVIFAAGTVPQYTAIIGSRTGKVVSLYGVKQGEVIKDLRAAGGRQSVPKEGAIALAQNALVTYLGMSSDEVAGLKVVKADRIEEDWIWAMRGITKPFWIVGFAIGDGMDYSVLLDAKTGMILVVHEPDTIANG